MSTPSDRMCNFGFLIYDIGRLFTKRFQIEAEHLGISLTEAKVLTNLSRNPSISQAQLAELSGVEPMTIVRILDRMEADKWIERRPHPTDRRARQLHLGERAQSTLEQILKVSTQVRGEALAGIKADERATLLDLLERVHGQLQESLSEQNGKASQRPPGSATDARATHKRGERHEHRTQSRITASRPAKTRRASR
jgi:DNA-binding MarR family transcriptional regulator